MRTIPITPEKLTGDILEAFHRNYLKGSDLADWARVLMFEDFDSNAVIEAFVTTNMHWEKVPIVFSAICREVGLSQDIATEIASVKQEVMIEECRRGLRKAAELFHHFDDLRKRVGFPEMIELRILPDNPNGTNDSGYYGINSRKHGNAFEDSIRDCLTKAGILK